MANYLGAAKRKLKRRVIRRAATEMKNRKFLRMFLAALLLTKTIACGSQETAGGIYPEQRDTADAAAHAAFLAGWDYLLKKTPEDALRAIALFEKALEIDPDYSRAYAALAQAYWHNSRDTQFNQLLGEIQMASSIYGNDVIALEYLHKVGDEPVSQAHALTARMLQRQRRFEEAMREARTAVELGPEDPTAHDALIENLIYAHELDEAIGFIDEALRLRPDFPGEKLFLKSLAYFTAERLEEALSAIESARNHNARQYRYAALHAAILAELGRLTEAKAAFEEYRSGLGRERFRAPGQGFDQGGIGRLPPSLLCGLANGTTTYRRNKDASGEKDHDRGGLWPFRQLGRISSSPGSECANRRTRYIDLFPRWRNQNRERCPLRSVVRIR
jgi:tetratricopeptide (TPR) repeat protein